MDQPIRFGLVGAGAIAQSYAAAFEQCACARLSGVADIRPDAAAKLAERFGCPSFDTHDALLGGAGCDAVVICTPPNTHPELTCYFAERHVHVLCEKPFAIDVEAAHRMVAAGRRAGVLVTMASKFRYAEDVVRAKRLVMSGVLGELILFENAFTSRVDMSKRWNAVPEISGGGVLMDNGTHSLDLTRYLLGPLADLHVIEGKRTQGLPVEDTVRIFVRSAKGVMGNIDLSWSINKELDSYLNIYGSQGVIRVGWKQSCFRQSSSSEWAVFGSGYDKVQAFRNQIQNFAQAIRGEEILLITDEDALASVEAVEAAYDSLRHQQENWTLVGPNHVDETVPPPRFANNRVFGNGVSQVLAEAVQP